VEQTTKLARDTNISDIITYSLFGFREKGMRELRAREIAEKYEFLLFGVGKKHKRQIKYRWAIPPFYFFADLRRKWQRVHRFS
jgi:hypothetical protein